MILVMKINSINQNIYIGMFTTSILRSMKRKPKHDYKNLAFEVHANMS